MHDTHLHLEILLQKLGLMPQVREEKEFETWEGEKITLSPEAEETLDKLLENHEFAIHATISTSNFYLVHNLFSKREKISFLCGSHPELVTEKFDLNQYLRQQKEFLKTLKGEKLPFIGIGECGLDYFYTQEKNLLKVQQSLFESQIQLALELKLPLVIHCRDSFEDLFAILKNFPLLDGNFLIHCFTGGKVELEQTLSLGGRVAFGGVVTYNSAKDLQEAATICPSNSFVLETDLPFLAPVPMRGKVCLPEFIDLVAQKAASLRQTDKETIWQNSKTNTEKLFFA